MTEFSVGFKRTFVIPGVVLTALEIALIVWPTFVLFAPTDEQLAIVSRAAIPILGCALVFWYAAMGAWLAPVQRAISMRRRGENLDERTAASAYRALSVTPGRALFLRTALWIAIGAAFGIILHSYGDWPNQKVMALVSLLGLHAFLVNILRAGWYSKLTGRVRAPLFPSVEPLKQFSDRYFRRILLISLMVGAGAVAALAAFVYYFLQLKPDQYLQVQTYLPATIAVLTAAWWIYARRVRRPIEKYLAWQLQPGAPRFEASADPRAIAAYRGAQVLPYRLAGAKVVAWIIAAACVASIARYLTRISVDDAVLMFAAAVVMIIGAALYESIWHRDTMRPLLVHLSVRHRLPVREIRTAFSLRAKMLISFGGLVLFACGLSLFWAFIQYKKLTTGFVAKQAQSRLDWVRSEVQGRAGQADLPPSRQIVEEVLAEAAVSPVNDGVVFYFIPTAGAGRALGYGGGKMGAPRLPWYVAARMRAQSTGSLDLGSLSLTGNFQKLAATSAGRHVDLGSVAVLYPGYRGRGPIQRPLKELLIFFVLLFGVCAGIVVLTVSEFTGPIRQLEQRADEMARGELARSVTSGGEGDEVGRLTFALEEMRRALREKLRSTEEVNLDLEREVQRRTADLAKKNKELAETLEKLTRAQSQLVRAEKMASIGQLVAGIAHEINNPVNAIANTVGPLREAIAHAKPSEAAEIEDMVRVIQNGARRTKEIVQALHNYSRTDDERIVDFDLNRGLDDSLELLRHHLKGAVEVERKYGDVGRVKGHAGQLNQVFMNLLTNAAQALAGRDGARIELSTQRHGDGVVIKVADNGPGIPAEILPKIFDPFFTTKEVGQGSGLGLSIVHGIVERHGGTIEVDSHVGQGTTFTVTLPAAGAAGKVGSA